MNKKSFANLIHRKFLHQPGLLNKSYDSDRTFLNSIYAGCCELFDKLIYLIIGK